MSSALAGFLLFSFSLLDNISPQSPQNPLVAELSSTLQIVVYIHTTLPCLLTARQYQTFETGAFIGQLQALT